MEEAAAPRLRRRVNWRPRPGARYCVIPEDFKAKYDEHTETTTDTHVAQNIVTSPELHGCDDDADRYSGYFDITPCPSVNKVERKTKSFDDVRVRSARTARSKSHRLLLFFKAGDGLATVTS